MCIEILYSQPIANLVGELRARKAKIPPVSCIGLNQEAQPANISNSSSPHFSHKYRTLSTSHLEELQRDIDRLKNEGKLSEDPTYRSYLQDMKFETPEKLPDAESLIIMAIPTRLLLARFHLHGKMYEVTFPSNYCSDGLIEGDVQKVVLQQIVKEPNHELERTRTVHLKLLAVRSGLGEYGRNNLCYVEGMGSLHRLWGFFTNRKLENNWNEIRMMQTCKNCKACMNSCPNNCIS